MQYIILLRPQQWLKNFFVFAPIFFAGLILNGEKLWLTVLAFIVFCLTASSAYILNDIADRYQDRLHPFKKERPVASRKISIWQALLFLIVLIIIIISLLYFLHPFVARVIFIYFLLNISYSFFLKHVAIIDILTVSLFYLLRVLAGGFAIGVPLSSWLILTTVFVALFLVIAKRKSELGYINKRSVLADYSRDFIDHLLIVTLVSTLILYSIYTVLGASSDLAVYSVFFVMLGLFRYLFLSYDSNKTELAEKVVVSDKIILSSIIGWAVFMYFIVY